jgi:hypothetical protein
MTKNGKQITTILNNELAGIFEQFKIDNKIESNFKALRVMIEQCPKFAQPNEQLILTGNVVEDKKRIDSTERKVLEQMIKKLDSKNRKEKNTIKRTGAFHNENFRSDLDSLLAGEVDLYEVKYHVDWWYYINQISTGLSRKGIHSSLIDTYVDSDKYEKPNGKGKRRTSKLQNKVFH